MSDRPEGELKYKGVVGSAPEVLRKAELSQWIFHWLGWKRWLNMEALRGEIDAYDPRVHLARGIGGQIESADRIRSLLAGSQFVGNPVLSSGPRVQDPVSFRSGPPIHGAVRDTLGFVETVQARVLNASTHNPMESDVYSGQMLFQMSELLEQNELLDIFRGA